MSPTLDSDERACYTPPLNITPEQQTSLYCIILNIFRRGRPRSSQYRVLGRVLGIYIRDGS